MRGAPARYGPPVAGTTRGRRAPDDYSTPAPYFMKKSSEAVV